MTEENIKKHLKPYLYRRILAFFLDLTFIKFVFYFIFGFVVYFSKLNPGGPEYPLVFLICLLASFSVYLIFYKIFKNTPGKKVFGLQIENLNGELLPFSKFLLRVIPTWLLWPINGLMHLKPDGRHTGDLISGSVVTVKQKPIHWVFVIIITIAISSLVNIFFGYTLNYSFMSTPPYQAAYSVLTDSNADIKNNGAPLAISINKDKCEFSFEVSKNQTFPTEYVTIKVKNYGETWEVNKVIKNDLPLESSTIGFYFELGNFTFGFSDNSKVAFSLDFSTTQESFYEDGQLKQRINYSDSSFETVEGKYTMWHENGNRQEEGYYTNGTLNGTVIKWHPGGQKAQELNFLNGKADGKYIKWYENGNKKDEGYYKNGELNGTVIVWLPNGNKAQELNYIDGRTKVRPLNTKEILEKACDENHYASCFDLGLLEHKAKNNNQARALYKKACNGKIYVSCHNLGLLDERSGDIEKAKNLYRTACDGKYYWSCNNLGILELEAGNKDNAKTLFRKACDKSHLTSCQSLGALEYQIGNIKEAKTLWEKACNKMHFASCHNLGVLEKFLNNLEEARKYYIKACDGKYYHSCTNLGILEKNAGNIKAAKALLKEACNAGVQQACKALKEL